MTNATTIEKPQISALTQAQLNDIVDAPGIRELYFLNSELRSMARLVLQAFESGYNHQIAEAAKEGSPLDAPSSLISYIEKLALTTEAGNRDLFSSNSVDLEVQEGDEPPSVADVFKRYLCAHMEIYEHDVASFGLTFGAHAGYVESFGRCAMRQECLDSHAAREIQSILSDFAYYQEMRLVRMNRAERNVEAAKIAEVAPAPRPSGRSLIRL